VSYNIHELQRELREKLFVVERGGIVPSPRALQLYQILKPVYDEMLQTIQNFVQEDG